MDNKKFNLTLSDYDLASQIARLLNGSNKLTKKHSANSISTSPVQYFVELSGQKVLGCVGILHEPIMDKIVHLSVAHDARQLGIGTRLLCTAAQNSGSKTIYMHVREDNAGSRSIATRVGFANIAYIPKLNYNILTFCLFRRNNVSRN